MMTDGDPVAYDTISIRDFLAIDDEDKKKYLWAKGGIRGSSIESWSINNEDKIGWFESSVSLKLNNQGKFYRHSTLLQWVVYNKIQKVAKVSSKTDAVAYKFLDYYFKDSKLVAKFINGNLTKTLVKKIAEGKINTIGDIIKYHKSYTLKMKTLDDVVIFKAINHNCRTALHIIEDPESLKNLEDFSVLNDIPGQIVYGKLFKLKVEDISRSREMYERWFEEKSERYDKIERSGNEEDGGLSGKDFAV